MRNGPKSVPEIDEDQLMSEAELYEHIRAQFDHSRAIFQTLYISFKKLCALEKKRRLARQRELKDWMQEKKRLAEEEQKDLASRMCFVCSKRFWEGQREESRSRSPAGRKYKLSKDRTGSEKVENTKVEDRKSLNEDCGR